MEYKSGRAALGCFLLLALIAAAAYPSSGVTFTPGQGWQKESIDPGIKGAKVFNAAFTAYLDGKYSKAARLFKKVIKEGDKSLHEEAGILLAECYLGEREYRAAFKQYEKFITDYPASQWIDRAYEGELECAKAALAGAKIRYIGLKIWGGYGFAEKVVDKITSRRPFSDYARDAQMALADSYFRRGRYIESATAYREYLELFGENPLSPVALLGVAKSYYFDARGPGYNPVPYYRSTSVISEIEREYPSTPQAQEAEGFKARAEVALAHHYYIIGQWYVKKKQPQAALMYFNKVLTEYRETTWAEKSKAEIDLLSGRVRGGNGS